MRPGALPSGVCKPPQPTQPPAKPSAPAGQSGTKVATPPAPAVVDLPADYVFGPDDVPSGGTPERPELPPAADRAGRDVPRPLPRPGLAGGTTEARGLSLPEKPDLA